MDNERLIHNYRLIDEHFAWTLGWVHYFNTARPMDNHNHGNFFEIVYFISGEQSFVIDDVEYQVKGGDLLISKPFENHSTGIVNMKRAKYYYMILDIRTLHDEQMANSQEGASVARHLLGLNRHLYQGNKDTQMLFDRLFELYSQSSLLKKTMTRNAFWDLIENFIECSKDFQVDSAHTFQEVKDYVDENIHRTIKVEELAEISNLSLSHFKMRFRDVCGITPAEFIQKRRIELSRRLLINTDRTVTEIAYEFGFSSSQYYSTVFRKHEMLTPSEFRKRHQK